MSCIFNGIPNKIELFYVDQLVISPPSIQEEMKDTHIMLKPFIFFDWKTEMVIQLRAKGLFRVTMGTEVEPKSVVEKAKYFNKLDEAYGLLFLSISREILFHLDSLKSPK